MSYAYAAEIKDGDLSQLVEKAQSVIDYHRDNDGPADEITDHANAVHAAVAQLVEEVGAEGDVLYVSVNGHANKDHAHADGFGDESITITVTARPPTPS